MAFPTWVGASTTHGGAAGGNIDFTASARASGDMLYVAIASANEAIATPTGFDELSVSPQSRGTAAAVGGIRLAVFEKESDGTETTVAIADPGNHVFAAGFVIRPATGQSIEIDASAGKNAAAATTHSGNAITTTAPDCLVVDIWGTDQDGLGFNYTGHTNADLASLTERIDGGTASGVGSGVAVFTGQKATAGSVAATTASSLGSAAWCAITLALKSTSPGYTLTADGAAVTLTGTAAGLRAARAVVAEVGEFDLNGSDATLAYDGASYSLSAESGSFVVAGTPSVYVMLAETGDFILTGFDVVPHDFRPRGPIGGLPVCCERCGFRVRPRGLRKEWTGLMVCGPCWDPRPADTRPPRLRPEGLPLRNSRYEPPPIFRTEGQLGGEDL